jgi:hypothetical protein
MAMRDLIPWSRGRDVAPARGDDPFLTLHREMNRLFDNVFRVQAGNDPSTRYAAPQDVLRDVTLSEAKKRDVLRRWALNAYLVELAISLDDPVSIPSRLDELIDALIDVDETELRQLGRSAYAGKQYSSERDNASRSMHSVTSSSRGKRRTLVPG